MAGVEDACCSGAGSYVDRIREQGHKEALGQRDCEHSLAAIAVMYLLCGCLLDIHPGAELVHAGLVSLWAGQLHHSHLGKSPIGQTLVTQAP